jgi:shikimate dehydrogenase
MLLYGLIGYPLTHSFSKNYFTEKFKKEGLENCRYENFPLADINDLPKIINDNPELCGINVTIPHKETVLPFLHEVSDLVKQTKACNCIKITKKKLVGYNTDVIGFEKALVSKLVYAHKNALILGTGGAAKAVEFVLNNLRIVYQYVSRYPSVKNLSYEQLTPHVMENNTLIINTTPLGMYPQVTEAPPLPYDLITPKHFLFDLIYNPAKTLFLRKGEANGATIENGYSMLVYQAEESWSVWNGQWSIVNSQ